RLVHPPHVQLGHGLLVHELDRQLGAVRHMHLAQHVGADRGELGLVDLLAGLVVDLDHASSPVAGRRPVGFAGLRPWPAGARRPRAASSLAYAVMTSLTSRWRTTSS